jgi:xylulokinase
MVDETLLVGFDVGTTSTKGCVFDTVGNQLASASASYGISRPRPGWAEQDPEEWWNAVLSVLSELGEELDLKRVAAIGVCSQVNTHVFVDEVGQALAPAIIWQDQRCAQVAIQLDASLDQEARTRIWGGHFTVDSSFLLSRVAWFSQYCPEEWERVRWVLSPKDYVNLRLTGEVGTDIISPVGLVGHDHEYIDEVFDLVPGARRLMPPLKPFTQRLGRVTSKDTGLSADTTAVVGTMDAWGNLYGSGVVEPGMAMEVAGTSEIIAVASDRSQPMAGVISFLPVNGLNVHAGPTQAGGDALRWFADANGLSREQILHEAALVEAGSQALVFLPHLLGERAPIWDSDARGVFFGLSFDHQRGHLARAILEGVAFSVRHLLETAEQAAARPVDSLLCSGGGTHSDLWCQIKADVLGRELQRLRVSESGVLGAAIIAGTGTGILPDLATATSQMVGIDRTFLPDERYRNLYDDLYKVYRELYPALTPAYRSLSQLRGTISMKDEMF